MWSGLSKQCNLNNEGFTLVELVSVIVLLGILSAYALPRLFDTSEISAAVFQNRAISILRNMQTRAMQDTRNEGYCYQVNFDNNNNEFGVPSLNYEITADAIQIAATCANTIDTSDPAEYYYVPASAMAEEGINLAARANNGDEITTIQFDSLGRANQGGVECAQDSENTSWSGCIIEFTGDSTAYVCVESEGYIYACEPI